MMKSSLNRGRTFAIRGAVLATVALSVQTLNAASIVGAMVDSFNAVDGTDFQNNNAATGDNRAGSNTGTGWNGTGDSTSANSHRWGANPYNPAGLAGNGLTNMTARVNSPGLSHSANGYSSSDGRLSLNGTNANNNMARQFGGQAIDSGTTYFSFLMNMNVATSRSMVYTLFDSGGQAGVNERLTIGQFGPNNPAGDGNIAMALHGGTTGGGTVVTAASPIQMGLNTTHLIIGKIEWDAAGSNEAVTVWVDPSSVVTEAAAGAAYISSSAFNLNAIAGLNKVRLFAGATSGAVPAASGNFDEIRFGGTWESVFPSAIPEPSSIVLFGLAIAFFGASVRGGALRRSGPFGGGAA